MFDQSNSFCILVSRALVLAVLLGASASTGTPDHNGSAPSSSESAAADKPIHCLSQPARDSIGRLVSGEGKDKTKAVDKIAKLFAAIGETAPGLYENGLDGLSEQLKSTAKQLKVPEAILRGILVSPDMGLDEGQREFMLRGETVPYTDLVTEVLKFVSEADRRAELKSILEDISLAGDETLLSNKLDVLVSTAQDLKLPLGMLQVLFENTDVRPTLQGIVNRKLDKAIRAAATKDVASVLKKKAERFAPELSAKLDTEAGQQFLSDLAALQDENVFVRGSEERTKPILARITPLATKWNIAYSLPALLGVDQSGAWKTPAPYCFFNGNSGPQKRDRLLSWLEKANAETTKAKAKELGLGHGDPASWGPWLQNSLSALQDNKTSAKDLDLAVARIVDALNSKNRSGSDLPLVYHFLESLDGLKLSPKRLAAVKKILNRNAQDEAGSLGLAQLSADARVEIGQLIEKLKSAKSDKKVPALVKQLLEAASKGGVTEPVKKLLASGTLNLDYGVYRSISRSLAEETMDPAIRDAKDGFGLINTSSILGYLGDREGLPASWDSSVGYLAATIKGNPKAEAAARHLIESGYFTRPQTDSLKAALGMAVASQPAPKEVTQTRVQETVIPPAPLKTTAGESTPEMPAGMPPVPKTASEAPPADNEDFLRSILGRFLSGGEKPHTEERTPSSDPQTLPAPDASAANAKLLKDAIGKCASCHTEGDQKPSFDTASPDDVVQALLNNSKKAPPEGKFNKMLGADFAGGLLSAEEKAALEGFVRPKLQGPQAEKKTTEEVPGPMPMPPAPHGADPKLVESAMGKCMACHKPDGAASEFVGAGWRAQAANLRERLKKAPEGTLKTMTERARKKANLAPDQVEAFQNEMLALSDFANHGELADSGGPSTPRGEVDTKAAAGTIFETPAETGSLASLFEPGLIRLIKEAKADKDPGLARSRDVLYWIMKRLKSRPRAGQNAKQELQVLLSNGGPELRTDIPALLVLSKTMLQAGDARNAAIDELIAYLKEQEGKPVPGADLFDRARVARSKDVQVLNVTQSSDENGTVGAREIPGVKDSTDRIGAPLGPDNKPIVPPFSIVLADGEYNGKKGRYYYPTDGEGNVVRTKGPLLHDQNFSGELIGLDPARTFAFKQSGDKSIIQETRGTAFADFAALVDARRNDSRFKLRPVFPPNTKSDNPVTRIKMYGDKILSGLGIKEDAFDLSGETRGQYLLAKPEDRSFILINEKDGTAFLQQASGDGFRLGSYTFLDPAKWSLPGTTVPEGAKHFVDSANQRTWVLKGADGRIVVYTEGAAPQDLLPPVGIELGEKDLTQLEAFASSHTPTPEATVPAPMKQAEKVEKTDDLSEAERLLAAAGAKAPEKAPEPVKTMPTASGFPSDAASALSLLKQSGSALASISAPAPGVPEATVPAPKPVPVPVPANTNSFLPTYTLRNGFLQEATRAKVDPAKFPANRIVMHTTSAAEAKQFGLSTGGLYWFRTGDKGELKSVVVVGQALPGELFGQAAGTSFFFSNGFFQQVRTVQFSQPQVQFSQPRVVFRRGGGWFRRRNR